MENSVIDVLIIDDCDEDREFIQSLLLASQVRRYRVRQAHTAAEGARIAAEDKPDCVLLDYRLPDADGLQFLQRYTLPTSAIKCPIVLMTGMADTTISTAALLHGAQDFLTKSDIVSGLLERVIQHAIIRFGLAEERREAMISLAEKEAILRMALEIAGIGTYDYSLTTGETRFGGGYFGLYGFSPTSSPFSYAQWLERIHPDDRDRIGQETERAIKTGHEFSYEYRVIWPNQTQRWLQSRGAVIRDESGKPTQLTGVNIDITTVKSAEEALIAANLELQQFALTAGHDLQAPLRTISVFTDLLEQTLGSSADLNVQQAVEHVRSGSHRMRMLVTDLMEYAQSDSPFGSARCAPLQDLLNRALENLASDIKASNATITWAGIPPSPCFGEEFVQVFQNLISNAINYCRRGVSPEIHVTCTRFAEDWVIAVKDNGRGFDMSDQDLIFQPFKRLVGEERAGTGLGLPICKRIVERNGGRIWTESSLGVGTTFFFAAPHVETEASPAETGGNNRCRASCA